MVVLAAGYHGTIINFEGLFHAFAGEDDTRVCFKAIGPFPMVIDMQEARLVKALVVLIALEKDMGRSSNSPPPSFMRSLCHIMLETFS